MLPPETQPSLIVRLQGSRNELAWTEFVSAYEPFLKQLVQRQGVPARHAADVSQQLLLAIARSVAQWSDDGRQASFRRWLSRVARNVVIKFMTRERREITGQGGTQFLELLRHTPAEPSPEQLGRYEHELIVWAAEQVRHEFRPTSWQAFWATQIAGRSVNETAIELGVSPGAIYMSRSRILARIKTKIAEVAEQP
jgi:RNA polymerase sigma-70 factor (ECF subfamily)